MLIEITERAMAHVGSTEVLIVGGVGCELQDTGKAAMLGVGMIVVVVRGGWWCGCYQSSRVPPLIGVCYRVLTLTARSNAEIFNKIYSIYDT